VNESAARSGIGRALARLPSGLYVLTAGSGAAATGMLVSWVQQVAFEPPALIVALRRGRPLEALVRAQRAFCLAVIDEQSRSLLAHFARGFEAGEPAFAGVDLAHSQAGIPYPARAQAHLDCRVRGVVDDWGDHAVVCGEVVAGEGRSDALPLVHVRRNGFAY
jgi:flavin reductase (DIM6/NTAB) family NADH-FMN oxidoreductase RutF